MYIRMVFRIRRRPDEGRHAYNLRRARWLEKICENLCMPHLHHRVMRLALMSAWREKAWCDITGENLLSNIRLRKCQQCWVALRDLPFHARHAAGATHGRQGPTLTFETALVSMMGEGWRDQRDRCRSCTEWRNHVDQFVASLCSTWGISKELLRKANDASS